MSEEEEEKEKEMVIDEEEVVVEKEGTDAFMQCFWDLASVDPMIRAKAATALAEQLREVDDAYTITRLARGLTSSRAAARQGFALALAHVLRTKTEERIPTSGIVEVIMQHTKTEDVKGLEPQDARDRAIGRVFGMLALIRSGRLAAKKMEKEQQNVILILTEADHFLCKYHWLGETVVQALVSLMKLLHKREFFVQTIFGTQGVRAFSLVEQANEGSKTTLRPLSDVPINSLTLLLAMENDAKYHKCILELEESETTLVPKYMKKGLIRKGKLHYLIEPLKRAGDASPRFHSLWPILIDGIISNREFEDQVELLKEFWVDIVEKNLVTGNGNESRRCTGILLFEFLLDRFVREGDRYLSLIPQVLLSSAGFIRFMIHNCSDSSSVLHTLATGAMKKLVDILLKDEVSDTIREEATTALLEKGHKKFDVKTGTQTIATLLCRAKAESLLSHTMFLIDEFDQAEERKKQSSNKNTEENDAVNPNEIPLELEIEKHRLWACEALFSLAKVILMKVSKMDQESDPSSCLDIIENNIADFFILHGFFDQSGQSAPVSDRVAKLCEAKFFAVIHELCLSTLKSKSKVARFQKYISVSRTLFGKLSEKVNVSLNEKAIISLRSQMSDSKEEIYRSTQQIVQNFGESEKPTQQALQLLFIHLGFQLLSKNSWKSSGDDSNTCEDVLRDFGEVIKHVDEDGHFQVSLEASSVDPVAVCVDIMLSMLSQPSSLLRDVVKQAFSQLCEQLTPRALETIVETAILQPAVSKSNDKDEENEEEEEEDEDEDSDESADEEANHAKTKSDEDNESSPEKESESEGEDEDEDESNDDDEDKTSEARMMEMDTFDRAIEEVLRAKKNESKKTKVSVETQIRDFKMRVFDLLDVYVDSSNFLRNSLPCFLMLPLMKHCAKCFKKSGNDFVSPNAKLEFDRMKAVLKGLFTLKLEPLAANMETIPGHYRLFPQSHHRLRSKDTNGVVVITRKIFLHQCMLKVCTMAYTTKSSDFISSLISPALGWIIRLGDKCYAPLAESPSPEEEVELNSRLADLSSAIQPALASYLCGQRSKLDLAFFDALATQYSIFGWAMILPLCELLHDKESPAETKEKKGDDEELLKPKKQNKQRRTSAHKPFEKSTGMGLITKVLRKGPYEGQREAEWRNCVEHVWKIYAILMEEVRIELKGLLVNHKEARKMSNTTRVKAFCEVASFLAKKKPYSKVAHAIVTSIPTLSRSNLEFIRDQVKSEFPTKVLNWILHLLSDPSESSRKRSLSEASAGSQSSESARLKKAKET